MRMPESIGGVVRRYPWMQRVATITFLFFLAKGVGWIAVAWWLFDRA